MGEVYIAARGTGPQTGPFPQPNLAHPQQMEPDGPHPSYLAIHFRGELPIGGWPSAFVIISAYATTGETWSMERNKEADEHMRAELLRHGHAPVRITAFDPVTLHAEPSWAVAMPVEEALALGRDFLQDAIFLVQDDRLSIAQCASRRTWEVGAFGERLMDRAPG